MTRNTVAASLSRLATFADADDAQLRAIAEAGSHVTVPQGWSLIWERTPADKSYVRLRTATVVAASPLEVLHFTREAVEKLYDEAPAFRAALDRAVLAHG